MSGERWVCSFAHPLSPTWSTDLHHCPICGRKRTPTPVPSGVAETTAGEREVEALAADVWNDFEGSPFIDITRRDAESIARSVLASPALAALLDRVRREEGERIAQAIEAEADRGSRVGFGYIGCFTAMTNAAAIARAASVGRDHA